MMGHISLSHMADVTRLTRAGKLADAMRLLRGETQAAAEDDVPPSKPALDAELTIDMVQTETGSEYWAVPGPDLKPGAGPTVSPEMPPEIADLLKRFKSSPFNGAASKFGKNRALDLPDGARFEESSYANPAGSRRYKLYVPSCYDGGKLPLIMMLHGCTQSPDDFAAGTKMNELAEQNGFLVGYPMQPASANASKCWNWFNPDDQSSGSGEPSLIAGITRKIMDEFAVDSSRVYIAGLSAGGAAAAIMGATYPDLYAAIGVHSGLACGAAKDTVSAFAAMRQGGSLDMKQAPRSVRTIVFHGDHDATVNAINGEQVITQSRASARLKVTVTRGKSTGGVSYTKHVHTDERGNAVLEKWIVHGLGHAWSGGSAAGSYTDPRGPDASREMVRFFLER